jgi:hypothetical protein
MTTKMKHLAKVRSALDSLWSFLLPFGQNNELLHDKSWGTAEKELKGWGAIKNPAQVSILQKN